VQGEGEHLIYDFNIDQVGDSLYLPTNEGMSLFVKQGIDSFEVAGTYRTRWAMAPYMGMYSPYWYTYIEGIGSDRHPFGQVVWMTSEINFSLSCMKHSGAFEYAMFPDPALCDLDEFVEVAQTDNEIFKVYFDGQHLIWNSDLTRPFRQVDIYNLAGQHLQTAAVEETGLTVAHCAIGLYIVQFRSTDGTIHRQVAWLIR
jgi:hypothetical protein